MLTEDKYFQTLTKAELWQRYCGFLDLSVNEFMEIQNELLMDEIERVADSILGKKIMGDQKPKTIEEFRQRVPLTTYDDYEPYLSERQEDALANKPLRWCHSAGRGGRFKWTPQSSEVFEKGVRSYLAAFILSACSKKGEVNIRPGFRLLATVAPPPYTSGNIMLALTQGVSMKLMPPLEDVTLAFHDRIRKGFQMALKDGVDFIGAVTSILARMGEEFNDQMRNSKLSAEMMHPKIISRLLRAWVRSKRESRQILPQDIWSAKGIIGSGLDTSIYKDAVAHYWGSGPHELYAGTEGLVYAMQSWNKKGMTFLPDMVFLEFIPHEELLKYQNDSDYRPRTVLLDGVEEGGLYEVVITQLYGMPLLRYRLNDIIKVIAIKDDEAGIQLPQIMFQRRTGETIDLAGLVQLDEKTVWEAISRTGIKYVDWSACKEYEHKQGYLRIYIELKKEMNLSKIAVAIDEQLRIVDIDYRDLDDYLKLQPVKVTLLSPSTFQRYIDERIKQGADIAHLKPNHINAPENVIQRLLELSSIGENE